MYTKSIISQLKDHARIKLVYDGLPTPVLDSRIISNLQELSQYLSDDACDVFNYFLYLIDKHRYVFPSQTKIAEKLKIRRERVNKACAELAALGIVTFKQCSKQFGRQTSCVYKFAECLFTKQGRQDIGLQFASWYKYARGVIAKSLFYFVKLKNTLIRKYEIFNNSTYMRKGSVREHVRESVMGDESSYFASASRRSPFHEDDSSQKGEVGGVNPPVSSDRRPEMKRYTASSGEAAYAKGYGVPGSPSSTYSRKPQAQVEAEIKKMTVAPEESHVLRHNTYVPHEDYTLEETQAVREQYANIWDEITKLRKERRGRD